MIFSYAKLIQIMMQYVKQENLDLIVIKTVNAKKDCVTNLQGSAQSTNVMTVDTDWIASQ